MRPFAAVLAGLAFTLADPAFAADPVKPEIGAGPHRDRSAQTSGAGEAPRSPQPVPSGQTPGGGAGAGAGPQGSDSSTGPSRPDTDEQQEDEKKASQAKEKMKRKPGFQEEAPSPRASRTGLVI